MKTKTTHLPHKSKALENRLRLPRFLRAALLVSVAVMMGSGAVASDEKKLSVYFVGNSLTASTTLDRVHNLFAQRGIDLQFGSQLSAGKSLLRHLNYAKEPDQKWMCWETSEKSGESFLPHPNFYVADPKTWRFGRYDTALVSHKWDALVMQPYMSPIKDDMEAIPAFMELALKNGATDRFYLYQTWPRRPKVKPAQPAPGEKMGPDDGAARDIDYAVEWTSAYTATIEQTDWKANQFCASRDYFQKLLKMLGERFPDLKQPIHLIPAGEVLFAIDAKIKAGALPGLKELAERKPDMVPGAAGGFDPARGANLLYVDPIHFNPMPHKNGVVGNLISGTTIFTVLSGENPVGLSAEAYGFDPEKDAALVKAIQETIWEVVTSEPATGVSKK